MTVQKLISWFCRPLSLIRIQLWLKLRVLCQIYSQITGNDIFPRNPSITVAGCVQLFEGWISVGKTNHAIGWIVIYPVDSVIQPSSNWTLVINTLRLILHSKMEPFGKFLTLLLTRRALANTFFITPLISQRWDWNERNFNSLLQLIFKHPSFWY